MNLTMPAGVPAAPGVYRFCSAGEVLYVGKARSLRSRISWYFNPSSPRPARTEAMLTHADSCTWMVCATETEALLLEASLIAELQPPFNVKLRADTEAYPYLLLTSHSLPRALLSYRPPRGRAEIFGPFPSKRAARAALAALERLGVRTCTDTELAVRTKTANPCLLGQLGRCSAPCAGPDRAAAYPKVLSSARRALSGETTSLVDAERTEMETAAAEHRYEAAATHRDRAAALASLAEVQTVANISTPSLDVAALCGDELGFAAQILRVRNHRVVATPTYSASGPLGPAALLSLFPPATPGPAILYDGPDAELLAAHTGRETLSPSGSGDLAALCALAATNARAELARVRRARLGSQDALDAELAALATELSLPTLPLRIECLDIAHLQGSHTRAAFAALRDGRPHPGSSRVVKLPDLGGDDYAAITAALSQRTKSGAWPDLLVVDGGPAQLAVALAALHDLPDAPPLCSLAKRLEEVYLPTRPEPLLLPADSPALYVLQRARDEAHRLANAASARAARAGMTRSVLEGVPGLGPRRRRRLLEAAGSEQALRSWEPERLSALSWLPDPVASAVYEALHPGECAGS